MIQTRFQNVLLVFAILSFVLIAGCSNQNPATNTAQTLITSTPTPESTFISPTHSNKVNTIVPTEGSTPTATQRATDPIIGTWTLKNAPYSGNVIFFEGGHGKVTVGIAIASTSKQFA